MYQSLYDKAALYTLPLLHWANRKIARLWLAPWLFNNLGSAEENGLKKLLEQEQKENEKLKHEIGKYVTNALYFRLDEVSPTEIFSHTENIKLAVFALAYKQNRTLGLRLAQAMALESELPTSYRKDLAQLKAEDRKKKEAA